MTTDDLRPARPGRRDDAATAAPDTTAPAPAAPEPAPAPPPAAPAADDEAVALERGRTAAVVAALGRMQMSIDVLTRRISSLEDTVRALRAVPAPRPTTPPPSPAAPPPATPPAAAPPAAPQPPAS